MGRELTTDRQPAAERQIDRQETGPVIGDPAKRNIGLILTLAGVGALSVAALMLVRTTSLVGRSAKEAGVTAAEASESQHEASATIERLTAEIATLKRQQDLLLSLGSLTGRISDAASWGVSVQDSANKGEGDSWLCPEWIHGMAHRASGTAWSRMAQRAKSLTW
jgi:hypothetical protein